MESLLTKGIGNVRNQEFPAGRNRYAGSFSPMPEGEFGPLADLIQPVFQEVGYAPILLGRYPGGPPFYREIKISHQASINALALAHPLYDERTKTIADAAKLEEFEGLCNKIADIITNYVSPKGWFGKRKSSSSVMAKPVFVQYNLPRAQAAAIASAFAGFMANLPRYERAVRVKIAAVDAEPEEFEEFLDFAGFPEAIAEGVWYEKKLGVLAKLSSDVLTLSIPCVPRTIAPDIVYNNLLEVARRFTLEFGGVIQNDRERAAQVMVGWKNVLSKVNLISGDDESRDLFIDPVAP